MVQFFFLGVFDTIGKAKEVLIINIKVYGYTVRGCNSAISLFCLPSHWESNFKGQNLLI